MKNRIPAAMCTLVFVCSKCGHTEYVNGNDLQTGTNIDYCECGEELILSGIDATF